MELLHIRVEHLKVWKVHEELRLGSGVSSVLGSGQGLAVAAVTGQRLHQSAPAVDAVTPADLGSVSPLNPTSAQEVLQRLLAHPP